MSVSSFESDTEVTASAMRSADGQAVNAVLLSPSTTSRLLSPIVVDSPESLARARQITAGRQETSGSLSDSDRDTPSLTPLPSRHSTISEAEGNYSPDERPCSYVEYSDADDINGDISSLNI